MEPVTIHLALDGSLSRYFDPDSPGAQAVCLAIAGSVRNILESLAIPGPVAVEAAACHPYLLTGGRFLRVKVNGREVDYPDALLRLAFGHIQSALPVPESTPAALGSWLRGLDDAAAQDAGVAFLAFVCVEAIKLRPQNLLGDAQVRAFFESVSPGGATDVPSWFRNALESVLTLRRSLEEIRPAAALPPVEPGVDPAEALMSRLKPRAIEIRANREYLRLLTSSSSGSALFSRLRDGLFSESGIPYPPFHFVMDPALPANRFCFRLNRLTTPELVGLNAGEILVSASAAMLTARGIEAKAASDPPWGTACAVVAAEHRTMLQSEAITVWDPMEYLILCLAGCLRSAASCFVDTGMVKGLLHSLERIFPATVAGAKARLPEARITGLLHGLSDEGVSLRYLKSILEAVVDRDYAAEERSAVTILNELPEFAAAHEQGYDQAWLRFVRQRLKAALSTRHVYGNTLSVYLLPPEIEAALNSDAWRDELLQEQIRDAIAQELAGLPPAAAQSPLAILSSAAVRERLALIIRVRTPRLLVLSHEELAPELNVQAIGRIGLVTKPNAGAAPS